MYVEDFVFVEYGVVVGVVVDFYCDCDWLLVVVFVVCGGDWFYVFVGYLLVVVCCDDGWLYCVCVDC